MNLPEEDATLLEDEGAGYLISVSDIMAGLLFVFLVTLVGFIINFQDAADRQELAKQLALERKQLAELERDRAQWERQESERERLRLERVRDDLTNARRLRRQMLEHIEDRLATLGIRVEVDHEHGVLRLTENAMSFRSGSAQLASVERAKLAQIGAVLMDVLPCFTGQPPPDCDATQRGKLEAVFIEGHTDNVPLGHAGNGGFRDNWELSAERAMYTYRLLEAYEPGIPALRNQLDQPLFSVSGYGENRPVVPHTEPTAEPRNRRIDLRFIMSPPPATLDPEPIREIRDRGVR
jgi:flagellar motor protein MotB